MSLQVKPDLLASAADDLADIHSTLTSASATAAASTTGVAAAALDEVSAAVTGFFNSFGLSFGASSAVAHGFLANFAGTMATSASLYSDAESQISSFLQGLVKLFPSPESGVTNGLAALEAFVSTFNAAPPLQSEPIRDPIRTIAVEHASADNNGGGGG